MKITIEEILGKEFFYIIKNMSNDFSPIDLDNLHIEWLNLGNLIYKYSTLLYGDDEKEGLEAKRANFRSDLAKKIREENPKIAENKLTNTITENEIYIALTQKVHLLRGVLETLKNRSKALDQICKLWIAQYWKSSSDNNNNEQIKQREGLKVENERRE